MRIGGFVFGLCVTAVIAMSGPLAASAKDCVKAVRSMSDFTIQGDAWMWWQRSQGQYERDQQPQEGSVLVFKRTGKLGRGHVSLVSAVIDSRTIEVDHTWLRSPEIRRGMTVIDVSANNDWSAVRVWNEPTDQLGLSTYPTYGFVLPTGTEPAQGSVTVASREDADDAVVTPITRAPAKKTTLVQAKAKTKPIVLAAAHNRAKPGAIRQAKARVEIKPRTVTTAAKPDTKPAKSTIVNASLRTKPSRQVASK